MNIQKLLPDQEIALNKYGSLCKREDAVMEIQKDRRLIARTYLLIAALFLLSFCATLFHSLKQNRDYMDLPAIVILFSVLLFLVYRKRYSRMEKRIKKTKEAIILDIPELIDKMIMLLNAGMVTETALKKISSDYEKNRDMIGRRALYEGLVYLNSRISETNLPLQRELSEYAVRTGIRELIRFSNIVEDNINKGSGLAEKLEREGALLWAGRKKHAEEKARLAETKLSLPLMLLLLSLMIITTAPILLSI